MITESNNKNNNRTAVIIGATGLVGVSLLNHLLSNQAYSNLYAKIHVLVRNPTSLEELASKNSKLIIHSVDFDELVNLSKTSTSNETFSNAWCLNDKNIVDVYCCLGTTIKKAKTKETMFKIDVEYPLAVAKLALERGAKHFLHISAVGANSSSLFFYSKIKGQLEERLRSLNYPRLTILRPSLLVGERSEHRLGEKLATKFYNLMQKLTNKPLTSMGVHADLVASAMIITALSSASKSTANNPVAILSASEIHKLGKELNNV